MLRSRALVLAVVCLSLASCKLFKKKKHDSTISNDPYGSTASTATDDTTDDDPPPTAAPTTTSTGSLASKLTRSYPSNNGLITVKYPPDWTSETVGQSVIQISRQLTGSEDEDLTFISIPEPISEELQAFTSVLIGAEIPKLSGYVEVWRKNSKCAGNVPGVEIEATWVPPNAITYKRWSCTFLKNGHGYSFAYDLPKGKVSRDDALLRAMVDNTKFN